MVDHTYLKNFKYKTDNPYHDRLEEFDNFVFRNSQAENFAGIWNQSVFKKIAPLYVEVGVGYGHFMMDFCEQNPEINYVGLDYRFKRSFNLAKKLSTHPTKNFRYLRAKGERLHYIFSENEVDVLFFFFPDPWPKTRQNKKRLFQKPFLEICHKILKPNGKIFIKTDHDDYATWMENVLRDQNLFQMKMSTKNLWKRIQNIFWQISKQNLKKYFSQKI